jgi:hypothetical protein
MSRKKLSRFSRWCKTFIKKDLSRGAVDEHKFNFIKKPQAGFEPATHTLRRYCSATELLRHANLNRIQLIKFWLMKIYQI